MFEEKWVPLSKMVNKASMLKTLSAKAVQLPVGSHEKQLADSAFQHDSNFTGWFCHLALPPLLPDHWLD